MSPVNPTTLLGTAQPRRRAQTAIIPPEQNICITYGDLKHQVQDVAEAVAAAGITRRDRGRLPLPGDAALPS